MKAAILGTVPASKHLAPFGDKDWEIWVCSPGNRGNVFPRITKWFELHGIEDLKGAENVSWNGEYFAWLREQSFPVFMQEPNDLVPQSIDFPRNEWLKEFGRLGRLAATSSIAWMIGYAIMCGVEEIGVFGVDMAATEEAYTLQKSGCLIMLNIAHERGIKVTVPLESCLATMPPLYGYAEASRMGRKLWVRELEIQNQVRQWRATLENAGKQLSFYEGALETTQYMRRTFVDGEEVDLATGERRINPITQTASVGPELIESVGPSVAVAEASVVVEPAPIPAAHVAEEAPQPSPARGNGLWAGPLPQEGV